MSHKRDRKLSEMSGGEQQRIAIAIALANNPRLLLADEPTGSVDTRTGNYILDIFRELNRNGQTIMIVTHDRMVSKKVSRVIAIRDGKTSSEFITKQSYVDRLDSVDIFSEDVQDEFAILDRAGRLQIPRELLDAIGVQGNKVVLRQEGGRIVLESPAEQE